MTIEDDELISLFQNSTTITDAMIIIATAAGTGSIESTLNAVERAQMLVMQAIKSNHAILHNIRARHDEIHSDDSI